MPDRGPLQRLRAAAAHWRYGSSTVATVSWAGLFWVLVVTAFYGAVGQIGAPETGYRAAGYAAVKLFPGGVRGWGVLLAAVCLLAVYGYGRRSQKLVVAAMSGLVLYWVGWAVSLVGGWVIVGHITAWEGPSKNLALAAVAWLVARGAPTRLRDR